MKHRNIRLGLKSKACNKKAAGHLETPNLNKSATVYITTYCTNIWIRLEALLMQKKTPEDYWSSYISILYYHFTSCLISHVREAYGNVNCHVKTLSIA